MGLVIFESDVPAKTLRHDVILYAVRGNIEGGIKDWNSTEEIYFKHLVEEQF